MAVYILNESGWSCLDKRISILCTIWWSTRK